MVGMNWFDVDRSGLAKLLERRGKEFALFELLSNAWDTNAKVVKVTFQPVPGLPKAELVVEDDDPNGFTDLSHAFTLFAESEKKDKSEKRGRFNLGEKLVLAICDTAVIQSTTGTIVFDGEGRRKTSAKTQAGSRVSMTLRMKRSEYDEALVALRRLIPPPHAVTWLNGEGIPHRKALAEFEVELPTEVADADGNLKRSRRKTTVVVYEPFPGETPSLYELGVPVVETGDKWHIDVQQKVPLNMDRDNVPPSFLREVRTAVVNQLHAQLSKEDANQPWVREATSDKRCAVEATETVMTLRFGANRVAFDPSDPEANALAVSKGYTVVHGGMMNATEWSNAKAASSILPAGQVTPSPKPYSPDGDPLKLVSEDKWTPGMKRVVRYAEALAFKLMNRSVSTRIANDMAWPFTATYGQGQLTFNLGRLGHAFFNGGLQAVDRLLIHEFGHEYESNHLSEEYHEALCRLGAKLAALARNDPGFFHEYEQEVQ
jgi:hypothetical protein